jgi:4-hydroxybenzoate polyprenyltransferase
MDETFRSARVYFWPLIAANVMAMAVGAGADLWRMAAFAVVLCALASFGFLLNDLSDRAIDLVNEAGHFERASPHAIRLARCVACAFAGVAVVISMALGPRASVIAAVLAVGLMAYSPFLRRFVVVPNVATAALASSPVWAPLALSAGGGLVWQWALVLSFVVLLTAREILMDVRDVAGDVAGGRATLATRLGANGGVRAGVLLTRLAVVPFAVAVGLGARQTSPVALAAALALASGILVLFLASSSRIPSAAAEIRPAIQAYVWRSRLAMALVPAMALLLARS